MIEGSESPSPHWHRPFFTFAAVMVYLLVLSGGIVCITDSSHGCPDWPICHGRWIPPMQMNSIIEYSHRTFTPLTLPFLLGAAFIAWRCYRRESWILIPTLASILCLLVVVVFGALVILTGLSRPWAAVDLGTALLALGFMTAAASGVANRIRSPHLQLQPSWTTGRARLALTTTSLLFLLFVSGVLISRPGGLMRCLNWPAMAIVGPPDDLFATLYLIRLAAGIGILAMIVGLSVWTYRCPDRHHGETRLSFIATALAIAGTVIGAAMPKPDQGVVMPTLSMACAAALWATMVLVTLQSSRHRRLDAKISETRSSGPVT